MKRLFIWLIISMLGVVGEATELDCVDGAKWWRLFDDNLLDSLIVKGREANYDVVTAMRRITISRAELGASRAAYYPQLNLSVGYNRSRQSGRIEGPVGTTTTTGYFTGRVDLSWEVDVFGKITSQVRQHKAQVRVSAAEYRAVMNSVDAQIATAYVALVVSRHQLEVARRHTESQKNIVHTTEQRFEAGLASKLDVAQARTLYYSTVAQIPLLESSIVASINSIAVMLGLQPGDLPENLAFGKPLPNYRQPVDIGVPSDIVQCRPDVVEAEQNVDVAAAALGIARKEYLPSLRLEASVGTAAHRLRDLMSNPSLTYSIAPTLSWTIFDGLERRYAVAEAAESLQKAVDSYNLTVRQAVQEVIDASTKYTAYLQYISTIDRVVENAAESTVLSYDLYRQGLTSFTNVDNAELNYLTYENTLVAAQGSALNALIELYRSLGGAWQ